MRSARRSRVLACLLGIGVALATGCRSSGGAPPAPSRPPSPATATTPPTVAEQVGEGPVAVFGANVYSPGQKIYKELRQEDSLMAFLACQGEPDRVEVLESPDGAPRIILEYTRGGLLHRGTVEIAPSAAGYYAAHPIDPNGRLGRRKSADHPERPAPPAKDQARKPPPAPAEPPPPKDEEGPPETAEPVEPEPAPPRPTAAQREDCPIEPWRPDCRDLCAAEAAWEWCQYED